MKAVPICTHPQPEYQKGLQDAECCAKIGTPPPRTPMGTSADLAVIHRGTTTFFHTSYDGYPGRVLAHLCATVAAAGMKGVAAQLDATLPQAGGENEDDAGLDRLAMGEAYLAACTARGRPPVLLEEAMLYEYGEPDFAHGGVVPLFAPEHNTAPWACERVEQASYILDMDRGTLSTTWWAERTADAGHYPEGETADLVRMDLTRIETLDPELLAHGLEQSLRGAHCKTSQEAQIVLDAVLVRLEAGEIARPGPGPNPYRSASVCGLLGDDDRAPDPTVHELVGVEEHTSHFNAAIGFLRDAFTGDAILREDELLTGTNDKGELTLVVDLRARPNAATAAAVDTFFAGLAKLHGMVATMQSEGGNERGVSQGGSFGGWKSKATDGNERWGEALLPTDRRPAGLATRRLSLANEAITDPSKRNAAWLTTILAMDNAAWSALEAGGVPLPDANTLGEFAGFFIEIATLGERAVHGSTRRRMEQLDEARRDTLVAALSPLDRHILAQLTAPVVETPSTPSRRATP